MKDAPVLHAGELAFFQLLHGLVRVLPHSGARRLGRALGGVAYLLLASRRRIALANLELAMPELDERSRHDVARGSFRQMTAHATELLSLGRFDAAALCRRWTLDGWEHVTAATSGSRAAFLMTAHFGYWEMVGQATGLYAPPVLALVRPLDNPRLDRRLAALRTRFGLRLIHKHGAARSLVRNLQAGGRLLVLLDQRVAPRDAVVVPFFGRPARTSSLIARLALKHRTPVVPVYAYPAPGGRYRVVARPAIAPESDAADPVRDLTGRCVAAVETEIRRRPDLWLWMHDRWKMT